MKSAKYILTGAIAATCASIAYADTTIYITGATAYRSSSIISLETLYGAGNYACVYGTKTGVTSEQKASHVAFRGSIASLPALGVVTVKCAWAGSVGGLRIIADPSLNINDQPGAKGWIPNANIPGTHTTVGVDETTIAFESGAGAAKADAAFSDAFAETVGVTGLIGNGTTAGAATGNVGVIPFEWVANNGVYNVSVINAAPYATGDTVIHYNSLTVTNPNYPLVNGQVIGGKGIKPLTKIVSFTGTAAAGGDITIDTPVVADSTAASVISSATQRYNSVVSLQQLQAKRILQGGVYYSQISGTPAGSDATNAFVYAFGRNADSGTRVSCLSESGLGALGLPQHLQPVITGGGAGGTGGSPARHVATMALWPAETVLGTPYAVGQSGYNGGGDLANALTAWGSFGVGTTAGGVAPLYQSRVGYNGGLMVGYVSRNDAETACSQAGGANTAHRLTWNGGRDYNLVAGMTTADARNCTWDGKPVLGYNDVWVQQGLYSLWEYEHFYRNTAAEGDANKKAFLNKLADSVVSGDPGTGNIPISTMKVTRPNEGGALTHVVTP